MTYPSRRRGRFSLASVFDPAPEPPVWAVQRLSAPIIPLRQARLPTPEPVEVEDDLPGIWRKAA